MKRQTSGQADIVPDATEHGCEHAERRFQAATVGHLIRRRLTPADSHPVAIDGKSRRFVRAEATPNLRVPSQPTPQRARQ